MFSGEAASVRNGAPGSEENLGGEDEVVPWDVKGVQGNTDLLLRFSTSYVKERIPYASAVSKKLIPRSQACLTQDVVMSCDSLELELTQLP